MYKAISLIRQPTRPVLGPRCFPRAVYVQHADSYAEKGPVCPAVNGGGVAGKSAVAGVGDRRVRGQPPKVRMAFLPDNWFTFIQQKTGVSGPYVLAFVFANYCLSKEIFVLEHEYYSGLSWFVIFYVVYNKFGNTIGSELDKQVDDVVAQWESGRTREKNAFSDMIKAAKESQWRAEGQKLLMDAKKENILMQLEAAYRERAMLAYRTVTGRMDYHIKCYQAEARIQQKWMIEWILKKVRESITPDFQKRALDSAIAELGNIASKA